MSAPVTGFPGSPRMLRGGLARIDPTTRRLLDVVAFQYNPDTVTRTLQPRAVGGEPGDRLEMWRLTGPPHETIKLDAELDAADQLEHLTGTASDHGLLPTLACLERIVSPTASDLVATDALYDNGRLEIIPVQAPLTVLVWGVDRVVPIVVGSLTMTEEAFDPHLRPIRVKVGLECKVLTTNDLPVDHLGRSLYLAYRRGVERLAALQPSADVRVLGLAPLP